MTKMMNLLTHDDLPVLLVVGHLVGRPQLTEAAATDLNKQVQQTNKHPLKIILLLREEVL